MRISSISRINWIQRWAGSYTFLSCSYWGKQYYFSLRRVLGTKFDHTVFIHRKGNASFYVPLNEFQRLGNSLAKKVTTDPKLARKWLNVLKNNSDQLRLIMKQLEKKIPTPKEYRNFLVRFDQQLPYHNFMKKTVDFLAPPALEKLLPLFTAARLYSESVYSDTECFFRNLAKAIAKKERRNRVFLTCLTQEELERYLQNQALPNERILQKRFARSALYCEKGIARIFLGKKVDVLESQIVNQGTKDTVVIKGISAYAGQAKGTARIVRDPHRVGRFCVGDILVTGMTRPEFLPVIRKANAIITDAGGVLCHAAIIARELRKPCIIGTEIATKVLKDGDRVEVDATKGIVRKL